MPTELLVSCAGKAVVSVPDMQRPAATELTDIVFFESDDDMPKVYRDEPILTTEKQAESFTPPQYREMRRMAQGGDYWERDAKVFYEQGKFMETFEDEFNYQGEFMRYFPTYQSMSVPQLRGYFSWRTKVRRGLVEKTSLSFVFVYIYELINQIGVRSAMEGFHALKNFWTAYKGIDDRISPYLRLWLKDYVVYNDLDRTLFQGFADTNFDRAVLTLLDCDSHDADEVFEALNSLSPYNLENSRFFKQYPEDVKNVVYGVFSELSKHHDKNCKQSLGERFFGKIHINSYSMFKSAVFYQRAQHADLAYEINGIYRYRCENGNWSCERIFGDKNKIQRVGALLKTIDYQMRRKYGFRSTLKAPPMTRLCREIVDREIDRYRESVRKKNMPEIVIDVSKLQGIRHAALETQNKLIVEDAPGAEGVEAIEKIADTERTDVPEALDETTKRENDTILSDIEYRFMGCLLYDTPYDALLRSQGVMTSVLVDAVNEKFFDAFGDTVIVYDDDRPQLVDDYVGDLKGIVGESKQE